MAVTSEAPADTTMMRIVHDALRRDLQRATTALTHPGTPGAQRQAIGAHIGWMMRFLHARHASEDDGLYPLVRDRAADDGDVLDVLDRMTRAHQDISPAMARVQATAASLADGASQGAARRVVSALGDLEVVLLPHLREEEDEAMPIASRLITAAEWQAVEQEHNLGPKSMAELGFEGHWLIDSATDADRATVMRLVPPIPRFALLHGFARRYRRHVRACWGDADRPVRRVQAENSVAVTVDVDIDDVWELVRDVSRVGEWSHECVGAAWLGDSTAAAPGARFRGRNRAGLFRWGRVCEIVSAAPYELTWRTVPTRLYPDSSLWRIALEKVDAGTTISQDFRVLRAPKVLAVLYALLIPAHRDRTTALIEDLERLGEVARRQHTGASEGVRSGGARHTQLGSRR